MDNQTSSSSSAARNPKANPNLLPVNPNWAQLQQQLKARRRHNPHGHHHRGGGEPPSVKNLDAETLVSSSLGKRKDPPGPNVEASLPSLLTPTSTDCSLTDALAMDCEMVGVSSQGNKSALARVTLVNTWGNVVYDEYVRPLERVVDFRTNISGILPKNMRKAKEFLTVQTKVAELIKGRVLIGHALHNDLKVLLLSHPKKDTRDTSEYQPLLREGRKRALKDLAGDILGIKIQQKAHCPVEDAQAAMLIYKKYKKEWEKNIKRQLRFKMKLKGGRRRKTKPTEAAPEP